MQELERWQGVFSLPVRVYLEDTDAGGIVFYVNYLKFMERARTEWLRQWGADFRALRETGYLFVVVSTEVHYRQPARMDDQLDVTAEVIEAGKTYLVFRQEVQREGQLLCEARVKVACVRADTLKPCALPLLSRAQSQSADTQ
jgi:tol-pal system-associated acyl-CoA thioesterase